MFDSMRLIRSAFFEELRSKIKVESKREDVVTLVAWLLMHFNDDGTLRSPSAVARKTIELDDVLYWLVKIPATLKLKRKRDEGVHTHQSPPA